MPVATSSHSRAPTGSGNQISSRVPVLVVHQRAVAPFLRVLALRARASLADSVARDAEACDVQLVDGVERARRVPGEHVGETGCEPASRDDADTVRSRVGAEREHARSDASRSAHGRERDPRADARRASRGSTSLGSADAMASTPWGSGSSRPGHNGFGAVVQRGSDITRVLEPARGDDARGRCPGCR